MLAVSDQQLMQWVADGDSSCLGTLFERHHRALFQYCRQLTRNSAVAEDLVQEVFMKVLQKASYFKGDGSVRAWMFTIAHNLTFDYLRTVKRRHDIYSEADVARDNLVDQRSMEEVAVHQQTLQKVSAALAGLPDAAQEVIWLGRFVFDNYQELAEALGCNVTAARVRMHRAMQQLNEILVIANGKQP